MMTCKSGCKFSINTECVLAEREGFEPPEPRSSTVFKTAAIDHSATSPGAKVTVFSVSPKHRPHFPPVPAEEPLKPHAQAHLQTTIPPQKN